MPNVSMIQDDGSTLTIEVSEGEILYDAFERHGKKLPHGCLAGSCGACRIAIISGTENLFPASVIEQNTIDSLYKEYRESRGQDLKGNTVIRLGCRLKVKGEIQFKILK